jgi:hypothetical protein
MKQLAGWVSGAVIGLLVMPLLLLVTIGQSSATPSQQLNTALIPVEYLDLILSAGATCEQVSPALLAAQIQVESAWNPAAVSPAGAQGIAQFMPGTWSTWGRDRNGDGVASPFQPADAIPAQAAFMCALAGQVQAGLADGRLTRGTVQQLILASYNCGFGCVVRAGGWPVGITETDRYVPSIEAWVDRFTLVSATVSGSWAVPLPSGSYVVTSQFGLRWNRPHNGTDLAGPIGTTIFTACDGVVSRIYFSATGGNVTEVSCGGGVVTRYLHQSRVDVSVGTTVSAGARIGALGNTGRSTGPHLHFEVVVNGSPVDPVPFMAQRGVPL